MKGNSVRTLKNYDDFYEKGEPRQLSDWENGNACDLRPINPILARLMIASDIQRIDEIIQPPILHFKLRQDSKFRNVNILLRSHLNPGKSFNKIFEHSIDPAKWILNYKHKQSNASLTIEEKQLEHACHEIESLVVDVKPRRHGKGSDLQFLFH